MRIEYAIPCRYAEATGSLATIVGAGIDTWWVQELPAQIGTMVALRAVGAPAEVVGQNVDFHCHVEAPDEAQVGDVLDHQLGPIQAPDARQDWALGVMFVVAIRWEAAIEGTYTIHLRVDESEQPLPMHVALGQPPS